MKEDRPPIPPKIKREVRQRCGFGCVICGSPLIQYDHMIEYNVVKKHEASNLTLLCPSHHAEKTAGNLPLFVVLEADKNPNNLRTGVTNKRVLYYSGDEVKIILGNTDFILKDEGLGNFLVLINLFDKPLINVTIKENEILLNIILYDDKGNIVLAIVDNELVVSTSSWDIEFVGTRLTIRAKANNIFIEIKFITPNIVHFIRGKIYSNNITFKIHPIDGLTIPNSCGEAAYNFKNCSFVGWNIAFDVNYEGTDNKYKSVMDIKIQRPD